MPQCRQATFFPWATPIPREARNSPGWHPPLRYGLQAGASSIAFGLLIAIEAAMGAVSDQKPRRNIMATIGTFKKSGDEYTGDCRAFSRTV